MKRKSSNSCIMVFIYLIIILLLCAISMYAFIFLILAKIIVWLLTKVYHFCKTNIFSPKENVMSSTEQSKTSTNICLPEENTASSTEQSKTSTNICLPEENTASSTEQSKTSTNICLPEENIASSTEQKEINYKNKGHIERRVLPEINIEKFAIECNSYLRQQDYREKYNNLFENNSVPTNSNIIEKEEHK